MTKWFTGLSVIFLGAGVATAATFKLDYAQNIATVTEQAASLGAPVQAIQRALKEAESSAYGKKDVLAVIDLSQHSSKKRFYLLDLRAGKATAYHVAHSRGNGGHERATQFRGFQRTGSNMTPLGPFRTTRLYQMDHYDVVVDKYDGRRYTGLYNLDVEGTKSYNRRFNRKDIWITMHTKWYVTQGYRNAFSGKLGRSLGCIVLDPVYSNQVFFRLQGGALVYITVGNDPIEKYL